MTILKRVAWIGALFFIVPELGAQEHLKIMASDSVQGNFRGAVSHVQQFSKDDDGEKLLTDEITFSPSGDLVEEKDFEEGKLSGSFKYKYDPTGTLLSCQELDGDGKEVSVVSYSYDLPKKSVVRTRKTPDGKVDNIETVIYDKSGLEAESRQVDVDGKVLASYVVKHNAEGKEIGVEFFGPDGKIDTKVESRWDPKGFQLSETTSFLSGANQGQTVDDFSEVKLDAQGNWIERKAVSALVEKGQKVEPKARQELRVIEYFKK